MLSTYLLLFFVPCVLTGFQCYYCSQVSMSDQLLQMGLTKALKESLQQEGITIPDSQSTCFTTPSKTTPCQKQCVHFSAKIDLNRYIGPNPKFDQSSSYTVKDIGKADLVVRGCLENVLPLAEQYMDMKMIDEDSGCINVKGHALGAVAGAQLCLCNEDRCMPGEGVPLLPPTPATSELLASESFTYVECVSSIGSSEITDPFYLIYKEVLDSPKFPLGYLTESTCFDPKNHKNKSLIIDLTKNGCKTAAVELGVAIDTTKYRGPEYLTGVTDEKLKIKGMNGKGIVRTCLDEFGMEDFPELPQDKGCLYSDASMWGLRGNIRVCVCNKNKCLTDKYDPMLPDSVYKNKLSVFLVIFLLFLTTVFD